MVIQSCLSVSIPKCDEWVSVVECVLICVGDERSYRIPFVTVSSQLIHHSPPHELLTVNTLISTNKSTKKPPQNQITNINNKNTRKKKGQRKKFNKNHQKNNNKMNGKKKVFNKKQVNTKTERFQRNQIMKWNDRESNRHYIIEREREIESANVGRFGSIAHTHQTYQITEKMIWDEMMSGVNNNDYFFSQIFLFWKATITSLCDISWLSDATRHDEHDTARTTELFTKTKAYLCRAGRAA